MMKSKFKIMYCLVKMKGSENILPTELQNRRFKNLANRASACIQTMLEF
ncbi:MAG: hypothetical protein PF570_01535 [Candidatus Cloacimonetes bacterium]|jgi:hypothetical protein|nr:hypothetical protein [Candidatus Cloacimonadota bacterium]